MLLTFILALLVFLVLAFRGLGFFAWLTGPGVWLVGWRLAGVVQSQPVAAADRYAGRTSLAAFLVRCARSFGASSASGW